MLSFDPSAGSLTVPLWVVAVVLAALVAMTIFAIARAGAARAVIGLIGIVILGYAGWVGWALLDRSAARERAAEHRAFEGRAAALAANGRVPGQALACLSGMAGEQVESACERAVFATPDSVAAAVAYVAAQVALLTDARDASRHGANYDAIIVPIRRGLETDRYGIVAHVMLQQENCSADQCVALALLRDANHVRSNLQEKPFTGLVAKYAPSWVNARLGPPMVDLSRVAPAPAGAPTGVPVSSKYDFPSSSSIPAVNIMGSEPPPPPPAGATATAPPQSATGGATSTAPEAVATPAPVPPRRPPAARPPARASAGAPPLAPPQQVPAAPEPVPQQ